MKNILDEKTDRLNALLTAVEARFIVRFNVEAVVGRFGFGRVADAWRIFVLSPRGDIATSPRTPVVHAPRSVRIECVGRLEELATLLRETEENTLAAVDQAIERIEKLPPL
jgi:hypothetical protein